MGGERVYPSRGVATICNVGRNKMMELLRNRKVLDCNNLPRNKHEHAGWFKVDLGEYGMMTTYWTEMGLYETHGLIDEAILLGEISRKTQQNIHVPKLTEKKFDLDFLLDND